MSMTLPPPVGGGHAYVTQALAIEQVAGASATLAVILTVTTARVLGPIAAWGTSAQRSSSLGRAAH